MDHRANVKQLQVLESSKLKSTIKSRKAELQMVKIMREQFEKNERIALRSSKVYQDVHKRKKQQMQIASKMATRGAGELYVDSDRRIAVGLGAEDLKGQVEKYKDELTTSTGKLSEHDILIIHILLEQAKHDLRNNKPVAALTYVDKALRLDDTLLEVLELKCQCYLQQTRYHEALEAADYILLGLREYHNPKALAVKADALYNMGNFEHSLVNFHKAMRYSTTREKGKLSRCIERTELAVLNAVGPQVSHYFKNLDKILVHITKTNILGLPWHKVRNVCAPKDTGRGAKVKDRKFLSELATDKRYLEGLAKNLKNENSGVGQIQKEEIVRETDKALEFLNDRRDFWSQQNPEYPDEIKGLLVKKASPLDVLMTRMIAKEKQHEMMIGMGLKKKKNPMVNVQSGKVTPFLNYKCESTAHVEVEPETIDMKAELSKMRNSKPIKTTGTINDCQQAKAQAIAIVEMTVKG